MEEEDGGQKGVWICAGWGNVFFLCLVCSFPLPLPGRTGGKGIREPRLDSYVVGDGTWLIKGGKMVYRCHGPSRRMQRDSKQKTNNNVKRGRESWVEPTNAAPDSPSDAVSMVIGRIGRVGRRNR